MISLSELPEDKLAVLLKSGSEQAFSEIYNRYWDKLYILVRKRLDDALEGEEVVQDIFCNLWRKRESFELTRGFNNYFAVAAKFEVINRLQKRGRSQILLKDLTLQLTELDESTLRQLDFNDLKLQLEATIKRLPEKCQLVFRLKHEQGYTQKRIAGELEISEKTVEAHLSKARKTIKDSFGSMGSIFLFL